MSIPPDDLRDIQGNVLAGFNTNIEVLVALTADHSRASQAATWLASLSEEVTSVLDVREFRAAMKAPLRGEPSDLTWLGLGMGAGLLASIRPDLHLKDYAFNRGYLARARSLGDHTAPDTWRFGGPNAPVDLLLIVASNHEPAAETRADELVAEAKLQGLSVSYRETARRIDDLEHFGFRDGVSQPGIIGYDVDGTEGAGHFVFGHEKLPGDGGGATGDDPKGLLRNGSLMVFRRLAQDVAAFRAFCAAKATELQADFPRMTPEHLAAILVGRWPSGALVSMAVAQDPGKPPHDNDFDFANDPDATSCPFGAHIRKVNPRLGLADGVKIPRILRRGIPFGPIYEDDARAERGLAFVSFQTSIADQTDAITNTWMNSAVRPGVDPGHDLLVGRSIQDRFITLPVSNGKIRLSAGTAQWITPTGGAYLFAPGKKALARLTEPLAPGVGWRFRRALRQAGEAVRESLSIGGTP